MNSESKPTALVEYVGNLRCEVTHVASGQVVTTDAPIDNHGKGEAFSPTDLLATSLAQCAVTTLAILVRNHGFELLSTKVEVRKIMASHPRRVAGVKLDFTCAIYPDAQSNRELVRKIIDTCPVSLSLHPDLVQEVQIEFISQ